MVEPPRDLNLFCISNAGLVKQPPGTNPTQEKAMGSRVHAENLPFISASSSRLICFSALTPPPGKCQEVYLAKNSFGESRAGNR